MERQRAGDISGRYGHLEWTPCLATILCPVVCRSASEYECLRKEKSALDSDGHTQEVKQKRISRRDLSTTEHQADQAWAKGL